LADDFCVKTSYGSRLIIKKGMQQPTAAFLLRRNDRIFRTDRATRVRQHAHAKRWLALRKNSV
jgi:hypothetical protein